MLHRRVALFIGMVRWCFVVWNKNRWDIIEVKQDFPFLYGFTKDGDKKYVELVYFFTMEFFLTLC